MKKTAQKDNKISKKLGAPNRNKKIIEDALNDGDIELWLSVGYSEQDIYNKLQISRASWIYYKPLIPNLIETIERFKVPVYDKLLSTALKKATIGWLIEEETTDSEGKIVKIVKKNVPPDNSLIALLLHNYGRSQSTAPSQITSSSQTFVQEETLETKKQELELKKQELARVQSEQQQTGISLDLDEWFKTTCLKDSENG